MARDHTKLAQYLMMRNLQRLMAERDLDADMVANPEPDSDAGEREFLEAKLAIWERVGVGLDPIIADLREQVGDFDPDEDDDDDE